MNETLNAAQTAIITALADYSRSDSASRYNATLSDLARHPSVMALADTRDGVLDLVDDAVAALWGKLIMGGKPISTTSTVKFTLAGLEAAKSLGTDADVYDRKPDAAATVSAPALVAPVQVDTSRRYISTVKAAPAVGSIEAGRVITAHSKQSWAVSDQSRIVVEEDRFELAGEECTYVYWRPATTEEAAQVVEVVTPAAEVQVTPAEIVAAISAAPAVSAPADVKPTPVAHWAGLSGAGWVNLARTPDLIRMTEYNPSTPELPAQVRWVQLAQLPARVRSALL